MASRLAAATLAIGLAVISAFATDARASTLDRHRPILVYDSDERYFARSVDSSAQQVVYGHEVMTQGRTWLQYWIYYAYNAQDRGIVRTGRHEGDWELLQLRLGAGGSPDLATLSQHSWAGGCAWTELRHDGSAPVVYIANGSHALYPRPGTADRPFPDPNDEADGGGRRLRPPVYVITDRRPAWVERRDPWGDSRAGWVPGEQSSPPGPKFQDGAAWSDPGGFHADRARDCFEGPPGRAWQTVITFGGIGLVVLGLLWVGRRRFIQSRR